MSDPSPCLSPSIIKYPRFFSLIRRRFFFRLRPSNKPHPHAPRAIDFDQEQQQSTRANDQMETREGGEGGLVNLQRAVKGLHFGGWEEKEAAAEEIKRLARMDSKMKKAMADLRVVPPLVDMVGSEPGGWQRRTVALQALIELANGSYTNKVLIAEAGILSKLPQNLGVLDESTKHELALLFLSISSLANSNFPLSSLQILPFLVGILESNSSIETKEICLCTLYNLSTMLENAGNLATSEVLYILLKLSSIEQTSEKALATLGNLVVTFQGKKVMESNSMVPESFIEILAWEEKPKSQELSAYILMILAHQSSTQRQKMANSGIVPVLLEVALLSSPLAQKRALKLLQWFKDERQMRMGPHSGPQTRRIALGSTPVTQREATEGKEMMKKLVKQSLHKNMDTITRRANIAEGSCSSKLKALVISSSSKSLPY